MNRKPPKDLIGEVQAVMVRDGGELSVHWWEGKYCVMQFFDAGQSHYTGSAKTLRASLRKFVKAAKGVKR